MHYQKYIPTTELQSFVECFYEMSGFVENELDVQSPPNCYGAIVINDGDAYLAYQGNNEKTTVPKAFVCGIFTSIYHLVLKGKINQVGVVFKSTAIHNFFNLRMSILVNSRMDLHLLLGEATQPLIQSISHATCIEDKIKVLEDFLLALIPQAKSRLSIIDDVAFFMDEKAGRVVIEEVADRYHISKRYLEKRFLEKVGVSPKFYARMKRFGKLANKAVHASKIDWQDIVEENGLHDQSHLVKEYIEFNKISPAKYYQKHQEMIRFVDDINLYKPKQRKEEQ